MSFRIEQKFKIDFRQVDKFYNWLNSNNFKVMYTPRFVNSVYFDNQDFSSYKDSEEGVTPRKKIRIRTYVQNFFLGKDYFLEEKINSVEGRFKKSKKVNDVKKIFQRGIHDNFYGLIFPKVNIVYTREYFNKNNLRITVDKNIKNYLISEIKQKTNLFDTNDVVMEIKTNKNYADFHELKNLTFQNTRFSKYNNALKFMFNQ